MYCDGVSLVIMDNTELACSHRAHDKITLAKSHGKNSPGSPLLHDPVAFCGPVQLLLWNRRLGMKRRNVFVQSFFLFCGRQMSLPGGFSARTSSLPRGAEIDPVTEKFLFSSVSGVAGFLVSSWVKDMQTAQTSLSDVRKEVNNVKMAVNMLALNTTFRLATLEKEMNALDKKMDEKIAKMDEKIAKMDEKIAKMDEKTDRNHAQLVEMIAARKRPWIR